MMDSMIDIQRKLPAGKGLPSMAGLNRFCSSLHSLVQICSSETELCPFLHAFEANIFLMWTVASQTMP